jgi:hypothetical protein
LRSKYDRTGQVWLTVGEHHLVVESTFSKDRRKMLHRCFRLESGGFFLLEERKTKLWEWIGWMTHVA